MSEIKEVIVEGSEGFHKVLFRPEYRSAGD